MPHRTAGPPRDAFYAFGEHVNPGLARFLTVTDRDLRFVRGAGSVLETAAGERYDDWIAGFGALPFGHAPEGFAELIAEHLASGAPNLYSEHLNPFAGALARDLSEASGLDTAYLGNSGSEAVEAALKLALRVTGRPRIAYAAGGYHGTTCGALACMAEGVYREGFEPLLVDHAAVPWDDLDALEETLAGGEVGAFLAEPVQVEAGLRFASRDYLRGARELCDRHGALLILDEVQTGLGRTGALFAFQDLEVRPDVVCLAKALGAGLVPISATLAGPGLWAKAYGSMRTCEVHESTMGGNALACVVAREALRRLRDPDLLAGVRARGAQLFGALEVVASSSSLVREVRWRGLLGGVALREPENPWLSWEAFDLGELSGEPLSGPLLVDRLGRRGILGQVCGHDWSVLRVAPPLNVDAASCKRFVKAVASGIEFLEEQQ